MDYPKNNMLGRQKTITILCHNQLIQSDIRKDKAITEVEGSGNVFEWSNDTWDES